VTARRHLASDGSTPATGRRNGPVYIPPQHGAWAFLALPLALGVTITPWTPLLAVLAVAWVAAYPMSYAASGLMRGKHPQRFRTPFAVWTVVVVVASAVLVAYRPWLVWVGLVYVALWAVNLRYARRGDERALVNDVVFVAECSGMVAVTWAVGAGDRSWSPPPLDSVPAHAWILVVVCALVLLGSTLHVKSLIRERRDPRFARASLALALSSLPAAVALGVWWGWPQGAWLVLPFVALAARSVLVPGRSLRPGAIGAVELLCFVLAVVAAVLASR
jgi:hypothetical protein